LIRLENGSPFYLILRNAMVTVIKYVRGVEEKALSFFCFDVHGIYYFYIIIFVPVAI
jgi:hypothetical protein